MYSEGDNVYSADLLTDGLDIFALARKSAGLIFAVPAQLRKYIKPMRKFPAVYTVFPSGYSM